MSDRDHVPRAVPDLIDEQVERLKQLFPEAFSEGRLDCEKLKATIGEIVDDSPERYSFTWAGKREAIELLQQPSWAALAPDREESVNFDDTDNIFIEGENLEVLKLLYKAYFGRVKMIYIDPPYNTGNDFVYPDDYADPMETYLSLTGQRDEEGNLLTTNPETGGRYHSAWLSMMYPRLFLARQLLRDDGVIFVSIDDNEVHNLRMLMNEVFGEENFIATVIWRKVYAPQNNARFFSEDHEYVLVYARSADAFSPNLLPRTEEANARYINPDDDERGPWKPDNLAVSLSSGQRGRQYQRTGQSENIYDITTPSGRVVSPPSGSCWRVSRERFEELKADGRIWWGNDGSNVPALKRFLSEVKQGIVPQTFWDYEEVGHTQAGTNDFKGLFPEVTTLAFTTPKPAMLIQRALQIATDPGADDLVMDFFAGSCTTAQAVMDLNAADGGTRRFVTVQLPEPTTNPDFGTIAEIGKERIQRVVERLRSSEEGRLDLDEHGELDLGFRTFRLQESNLRPWPDEVPADMEVVPERLQEQMDPLREGWSEEAVIAEVALKEGFGLNYRLDEMEGTEANTVYRVVDPDKEQTLFICLDEKLQDETWQGLSLDGEDLFICRDVALTDTQAANLALQCRLHTI